MTTRRCAWCRTILEQGDIDEPITDTCCLSCAAEIDADIARDKAKQEVQGIVHDLCEAHDVTGKY